MPVTIPPGLAEALEFEPGSFDSVVPCLVLCSVTAPSRAPAELFRVLITAAGFRVEKRESLEVGPRWGITNPHVFGRAARPIPVASDA